MFEEDYKQILAIAWDNNKNSPNIYKALQEVSIHINNWAKEKVGSLSKIIKSTRRRLNSLRREAEDGKHSDEIRVVERELDKLFSKEEIYWNQRSRVNWLRAGNRNTSFFHKTALARRKRNKIRGQFKDRNIFQSNQKDIEAIVKNFYLDLFTTNHPGYGDIQRTAGLIKNTIPREDWAFYPHPSPKTKSAKPYSI